jgi:hypothetical protein
LIVRPYIFGATVVRNAEQFERELGPSAARVPFVLYQVGNGNAPIVDLNAKARLDVRLSQHGKELTWMALPAG